MSWKRYQNELMVFVGSLLLLLALLYKHQGYQVQQREMATRLQEIHDFKEIVALKRVWDDKQMTKRVEKLKQVVPASKVTWRKKGKKLTATYSKLSAKELNQLVSKLLTLAVEITKLGITKRDTEYRVELRCKW